MLINIENVYQQLLEKNPAALDFLIDTFGSQVNSLIYRILSGIGKNEDMEECTSDVFVLAWENAHKYDSAKGELRTWLLILAKYKALDYRRKLMSKQELPYDVSSKILQQTLANQRLQPVEEQVVWQEINKKVISEIKEFGEVDQQIFIRRYFWYEEIERIAESLGLSRKAIDNRLWRMRNILREVFKSQVKEG